LAGTAVAWWLLLPSRLGGGITRASFRRVGAGMTQREVEAVFRAPPGDYQVRTQKLFSIETFSRKPGPGRVAKGWSNDEWYAEVEFDEHGRALRKTLWECRPFTDGWTPMHRLLMYLGMKPAPLIMLYSPPPDEEP
jgi:hypothetical protein